MPKTYKTSIEIKQIFLEIKKTMETCVKERRMQIIWVKLKSKNWQDSILSYDNLACLTLGYSGKVLPEPSIPAKIIIVSLHHLDIHIHHFQFPNSMSISEQRRYVAIYIGMFIKRVSFRPAANPNVCSVRVVWHLTPLRAGNPVHYAQGSILTTKPACFVLSVHTLLCTRSCVSC